MTSFPWLEIIFTSTAFLLLLIYHIHLTHQLRTAPTTTSIGLIAIYEATPKTWMAAIKPEDANGSDLSSEGGERL